MNFRQFLVPRLDGVEIEKNFAYYADLARKGVAGFIVFGGEVGSLRKGISKLQEEAPMPLMIASDLEQGLGQQVRGGTIFPPAAAIAQTEKSSPGIARKVFECIALEAAYAGINTIFAPVLDVNTNPDNPIISTRAFSDDTETVTALGRTMIEAFLENGVIPCGKHFPGHGNTITDSHIALPRVEKSLDELEACELRPFRMAVSSGVTMMMLGHLSVPALDPNGVPVSISKKALRFLRDNLGFKGISITDAMNMGGLGNFSAIEAAIMALEAGVDLLLHPEEPEKLASELEQSGKPFDSRRVEAFRKSLSNSPSPEPPSPTCEGLSIDATVGSIVVEGTLRPPENPFVLILSDGEEDGSKFIKTLKTRHPSLGHCLVSGKADCKALVPPGAELIVAVFSPVKAFKGGSAPWIKDALLSVRDRIRVAVSFGGPQLIGNLDADIPKLYAWWGSETAQLSVVSFL